MPGMIEPWRYVGGEPPFGALAVIVVQPGEYLDPGPGTYHIAGRRVYMREELYRELAARFGTPEARAYERAKDEIERIRQWSKVPR